MKIQKWNIRGLLFLAVLLLVFALRPADALAAERTGMITGFEKVSGSCITLSDHIPLEELKEQMPREITVYLNGSREPVRIAADWVSGTDYNSSWESYYLFMARWDETRYPLDPGYNDQGYLPFVEVVIRDQGQPAAIAAASGVSNIVKRAYQQVDIEWTPLKQVNGYTGLNGSLTATYHAGTTYHGIPYGQLVDSGKYVPHDASFDEFLEAVNKKKSVFYTDRGSYMSRDSTYYGNDCSAFVSYAYGLPRMTTGMIDASSQFTRVSGNNIYNAQVGDCFNKSTSHVELITGMLYNNSGTLVTVEVCEQTPPKARKVRYTPAQVQSIINSGYVLLRFNGRDSVRPPYYYEGYTEKTDTLAYIGDSFFASIVNKSSGMYAVNDGAGNVAAGTAGESADRLWYFEAQSDGTYLITSCKGGTCMGVRNSETANGTNVEVGGYTGSKGQRWYIYRSSNGKYKLVAASGNSVLTLTDKTNMTMWEDEGKGTQGFEIRTVERKGSVHMAAVLLSANSCVYDGTEKRPAATVMLGTAALSEGADYVTAYNNNVNAGKANVTITGIGEYTGEFVQEFEIEKAPQDLQITLSSDTGKEGEILQVTVAGNQTDLKFSSENKEVAKVGQKGKITCLKAGTAQIKIKAASGDNYKAETRLVDVTVEHDYIVEVTEPTCVEQGYTTYTCSVCGDTRVEDYTEALGHSSDEGEVIKEANCTEDGEISHTCSVCGTVYSEVVPATGHDYGDWKANDDGTHTRVCANDPEHTETEDCVYEYELIKAVDDGQEGEIGYTCSVCGYSSTKTVSLENCAHEITEVKNIVDATCTKEGSLGDTYCRICGALVEQGGAIPAAGHVWDAGVVTTEPEVGKAGEKTFTCSVCGDTYTEPVEALPAPPEPETPGTSEGTVPPAQTEAPGSAVLPPEETPKKPKKLTAGSIKKDTVSGGVYKVGKDRVTVEYKKPVSANKKTVEIPDTVTLDGIVCKVTAISANAFKNNQKLQQVSVGKNVQEIRSGAFQNCRKLTVVFGGSGVKTIKKDAFCGCVKLSGITLGSKVTMLGARAFKDCKALTRITIPSKIKSIGSQAFYGCGGLRKITIRTVSLKNGNVGAGAFKGTSRTAVAVVPSKVLASYTKLLKARGMNGKVRK